MELKEFISLEKIVNEDSDTNVIIALKFLPEEQERIKAAVSFLIQLGEKD